MEYRIAMIGCGTVGRGLLEILRGKAEALRDEHDFEPRVVAITDLAKGWAIAPDGLDLGAVLEILERGGTLADYRKPRAESGGSLDPIDMLERVEADILAEATFTNLETGEPAAGYVRKALRTGKNVVTSNKGPAALHYAELAGLARTNGLQFRIEGTVMSGTPVFSLFECGLAGNRVREVLGILNGTTNFILTKMETEGMSYGDALALAQRLGYAEADPTADVEGHDARGKVVILSNVVLGGRIRPADVPCTGISGIRLEDVRAAAADGHRFKLIASARRTGTGIEASVAPRRLPLTDPLAGVMGAQNALTAVTDLMGPVTIQGAGAGKTETGYSLLSDMLSIHRCRKQRGGAD